MKFYEDLEVNWNLEILGFDRGKRKILHQHTHNIIVEGGRQFIAENLSAASFPTSSTFTRTQNTVARYVGFGVGGTLQNSTLVTTPTGAGTVATDYPGTNAQTDADTAVGSLERPVQATSGLWMRQVAAPATYPNAHSVTWTAAFSQTDINVATSSYASVPLSEIALYKSSADPALANGGAGSYPGPTGHVIAYDTFLPVYKTGFWSVQVNWTWRM